MRQEVKTVPVHSLGLSQIISYGALFYVFAQIKIPLSEKIDLDLWITSLVITLSLFIHVINSAYVGLLVDKIGGLKVLSLGLFFGSAGMFGLGVSQDAYSFLLSMVLVGLSFSMSSYNVAFSTAIQLDDTNSRRNITIITFYGAVASSICWLSIGPIHSTFGIDVSFYFLSGLLFSCGIYFFGKSIFYVENVSSYLLEGSKFLKEFRLSKREKKIIFLLMIFGFAETLIFSCTALSLIQYFSFQFGVGIWAIILASLYGPFQLIGRLIEMKFAKSYDARVTGLIATFLVPFSLVILFIPSYSFCIFAMALFGMGHGLLTVTGGFLPNLYFKPNIIGRVKGFIGSPTALGMALAPFLSGLFSNNLESLIIFLLILSTIPFLSIFMLNKEEIRNVNDN